MSSARLDWETSTSGEERVSTRRAPDGLPARRPSCLRRPKPRTNRETLREVHTKPAVRESRRRSPKGARSGCGVPQGTKHEAYQRSMSIEGARAGRAAASARSDGHIVPGGPNGADADFLAECPRFFV